MEGYKIGVVEGDGRLIAKSGPNFLFLFRSRLCLPPRGVFHFPASSFFWWGMGGEVVSFNVG